MATTTDVGAGVQMIALERIRHDNNVRDVAAEDVAALAGSIALLGQITPVIVRPDGDGYLLVAGHKRYAALRHLGPHRDPRRDPQPGGRAFRAGSRKYRPDPARPLRGGPCRPGDARRRPQ